MHQSGASLIDVIVALALCSAVVSAGGSIGVASARHTRTAVAARVLLERLKHEALNARLSGHPTCIGKRSAMELYIDRGCDNRESAPVFESGAGLKFQLNFAYSSADEKDRLVYRPRGTATPGTLKLSNDSGACTVTQPLWALPRLDCHGG